MRLFPRPSINSLPRSQGLVDQLLASFRPEELPCKQGGAARKQMFCFVLVD